MSAEEKIAYLNQSGTAGKTAMWQQKVDNPQPYSKRTPTIRKVGSTMTSAHPAATGGSTAGAGAGSGDAGGTKPGGVKRVWDGTCYRQVVVGHEDEEGYGRPEEGSKSERRGHGAGKLITGEVVEVCFNILRVGHRYPDGSYVTNFGTLFEMYTKISNKLVGMLLRARRQGLITFEGEMLFQRRDEHVVIRLGKIPKALEECYIQLEGSVPDHMKSEH